LKLNKNKVTVHGVVNGLKLKEPLLDIDAANERERGTELE
jgi:hypothetical protein